METKIEEIWKEIVGYEGRYEISNLGRVNSLPKYKSKKGRILKTRFNLGYPCVCLYNDKGNQKLVNIHRLIAKAFIPNPLGKPCINHKNGNRSDNSISNLEWVTYSENTTHAYKTGLLVAASGERHGHSKLSIKEVADIRLLYSKTPRMSQSKIAKIYKIDPSMVSYIVNKKYWR